MIDAPLKALGRTGAADTLKRLAKTLVSFQRLGHHDGVTLLVEAGCLRERQVKERVWQVRLAKPSFALLDDFVDQLDGELCRLVSVHCFLPPAPRLTKEPGLLSAGRTVAWRPSPANDGSCMDMTIS
jgi:hypothetical protein